MKTPYIFWNVEAFREAFYQFSDRRWTDLKTMRKLKGWERRITTLLKIEVAAMNYRSKQLDPDSVRIRKTDVLFALLNLHVAVLHIEKMILTRMNISRSLTPIDKRGFRDLIPWPENGE